MRRRVIAGIVGLAIAGGVATGAIAESANAAETARSRENGR